MRLLWGGWGGGGAVGGFAAPPRPCPPRGGPPRVGQNPATPAASTVAKHPRLMTSLYPGSARSRLRHARDSIGEAARREAHRLGELLHRQRLLPGRVGGAAQQRLRDRHGV